MPAVLQGRQESSREVRGGWCDGATLAALIRHRAPRWLLLKTIVDLGKGTQAMHAKGVQHSDIKPLNAVRVADRASGWWIFDDRSVGKLIDLGACIWMNHPRACTPDYAPPELFRKSLQLTPAVDVYGLSATTFEALTGQRPPRHDLCGAESHEDFWRRNLKPHQLDPTISVELSELVCEGLRMSAEERPPLDFFVEEVERLARMEFGYGTPFRLPAHADSVVGIFESKTGEAERQKILAGVSRREAVLGVAGLALAGWISKWGYDQMSPQPVAESKQTPDERESETRPGAPALAQACSGCRPNLSRHGFPRITAQPSRSRLCDGVRAHALPQ